MIPAMKNDAQIAILVDARSREAIRVHSQAGGFDVAGNAVEVDRRQAGFEQTVAGGTVAHTVGLLFANLVLYIIQSEIAEYGAVEQVTDYLPLGQACEVFRFQFLSGAFRIGLQGLGLNLANHLQVKRQGTALPRKNHYKMTALRYSEYPPLFPLIKNRRTEGKISLSFNSVLTLLRAAIH